MKAHGDDGTAAAMARVLAAERDAAEAVQRAHADASARLEAARDEARQIVNTAAERIARRQQRHARALAARLARRDAEAASPHGAGPADDAAIAAAVAQVAARLSGGPSA